MSDYLEKLRNGINGSTNDQIILVETTPEKSQEVTMELVKLLLGKNDKGIVVSANRPYTNLVNVYKRNDINVSKMFILDCISKNQNGGEFKADNAVFIENLSSLTDISLSINEHLNGNSDSKFVIFDSITTMLIHNKPYIFARFIHNVLTKMRIYGVGGVLISISDNSNREIRAEIAQLCDKVITI
jgi:hypothetical protein